MTLVAALKINKSSVIMAADCSVTVGDYNYELARKVRYIEPMLIGRAGIQSEVNLMMHWLEHKIMPEDRLRDVFKKVRTTYNYLWKREFQRGVLEDYGIRLAELKNGNIDPKLREELLKKLKSGDSFSPSLLFCGHSDNEARIYKINKFNRNISSIGRYESIGAGSTDFDKGIRGKLSSNLGDIAESSAIRMLAEGFSEASHYNSVGRLTTFHRLDSKGYSELSMETTSLLANSYILHSRELITDEGYKKIMDAASFDDEAAAHREFDQEVGKLSLTEILKKFPLSS
ncbi:MAG: hypothetical protein ABIB71_04270 [Candidatus Woesearchaeota archaeon]